MASLLDKNCIIARYVPPRMNNIKTNKLYGRRLRPTRHMPQPACKNPTSQAFIGGHFDSSSSNRLPSLKFVGDTLSVSALIGLVTLTFDLLTSNLVLVIASGVGNFPTTFGISGTFVLDLWANTSQTDHMTLRP